MKIGILGTAHTFHQAPFTDASWELWACNLGEPPQWDRWFQLHNDATIDGIPGHREWLAAQTKRIYLQKEDPAIPMGVAYPLLAMTAKYGTWFFTSSIAFMLALALEEEPEEIGLWGVDMADSTEYGAQKNGVRFFLQLARMRGIKITLPAESEVLVPGKIYGYQEPSWLDVKVAARTAELTARTAENEGRRTALILEKASLMGARDISIPAEAINARLKQVDVELGAVEQTGLVLSGALQDMEHVRANWLGKSHG